MHFKLFILFSYIFSFFFIDKVKKSGGVWAPSGNIRTRKHHCYCAFSTCGTFTTLMDFGSRDCEKFILQRNGPPLFPLTDTKRGSWTTVGTARICNNLSRRLFVTGSHHQSWYFSPCELSQHRINAYQSTSPMELAASTVWSKHRIRSLFYGELLCGRKTWRPKRETLQKRN